MSSWSDRLWTLFCALVTVSVSPLATWFFEQKILGSKDQQKEVIELREEAEPLPPPPEPPPPEQPPPEIPEPIASRPGVFETHRTSITHDGRKLTFDCLMLSRECEWVLNSAEHLSGVCGEKENPLWFLGLDDAQPSLEHATGLVAVGAASTRGSDADQYWLAMRRENTLGIWLNQIPQTLDPSRSRYYLNLGRWQSDQPAEDRSSQRPAAILLLYHSSDVETLEQLYVLLEKAFEREDLREFVEDYDCFDLRVARAGTGEARLQGPMPERAQRCRQSFGG